MTLWKGFQKPKRLEIDSETLTSTYGKFYAQPFERGFGTTIGNALRRVLLSSIEGAAITAVKIEGVLHEFSSLPGVVGMCGHIILNLKQIPSGCTTEAPHLDVERKGKVTATDLRLHEILEPDAPIATLSENGRLRMEMRVSAGRVRLRRQEFRRRHGHRHPIDLHSPCAGSATTSGRPHRQATDYDRHVLEVWTNGTISPTDAVGLAATPCAITSRSSSTPSTRRRSRASGKASCRRTWRNTSTSRSTSWSSPSAARTA